MPFHYIFYDTTELIVAEVDSDLPLPGINVGNELILTTETYGRVGGLLHIQSIRVATSINGGKIARYDLHVICRFGDSLAGF